MGHKSLRHLEFKKKFAYLPKRLPAGRYLEKPRWIFRDTYYLAETYWLGDKIYRLDEPWKWIPRICIKCNKDLGEWSVGAEYPHDESREYCETCARNCFQFPTRSNPDISSIHFS